jgi:hypothetical protein
VAEGDRAVGQALTLLEAWLTFAQTHLRAAGWQVESPPAIATDAGEALRALVAQTRTLLVSGQSDEVVRTDLQGHSEGT